jgi:hypothetical protein
MWCTALQGLGHPCKSRLQLASKPTKKSGITGRRIHIWILMMHAYALLASMALGGKKYHERCKALEYAS